MNNVDDIVISDQNKMMGIPEPQNVQKPEPITDIESTSEHIEPQVEQPIEHKIETQEDPYQSTEPQESKKEEKSSDIDEYGNPVKKQKTYSEEEVQRIVRERLARVKAATQPQKGYEEPQQSVQQHQDQNVEENWERQLETFIDKRLEQKVESEKLRAWQEKEIQRQTEFEQKFSMGMERYSDFRDVVSNKPITDSMMLSIRNLDNPAAFIYGASKLHPAEIERIAKIEDPYTQAAEMGKLHERMIKDRKIVSSAPKPIEQPRGDMGLKNSTAIPTNYASSDYQSHITSRINEYAKQKRR